MSKKFPIVLVAAAAGALVLASANAAGQTASGTTDHSKMSHDHSATGAKSADAKFAMDAAKGGMMEVELGKIAVAQASSPDVKQFGQRMVDDHSKANDELKQIASQKGITLPTSLDAAAKAKMDKMSKMSGAAFDKAYMRDMVEDHKKDVAEFKKESGSGQDADIKSFAGKTLPTLEDHLKMAQDTNSKVAGAKAASASR
jgi:putative membrane protein